MLVEWLVERFWQTPSHPALIYRLKFDCVVAISYSSMRDRLGIATDQVLRASILHLRRNKDSILAYGDAGNSFPGAEVVEGKLKREVLDELHVEDALIVQAGRIMNSVTEAATLKKVLASKNKRARKILVVCTMMHSRSVRYIWEKTFPDASIAIYCIDGFTDVEEDQQILLQRTKWLWFLANVFRHAALRIFGLKIVGRVVHLSAG